MARHKEITSKAVSAILLLLLKWFKASRKLCSHRAKLITDAMKGHFLAQLLFDSNCLLLVLKMFGLSDIFAVVQTKNDIEDSKFVQFTLNHHADPSLFRYCYLNCSKIAKGESAIERLRRSSSISAPPKSEPKLTIVNDSEVYIVTDYSWRNFFSTINFLKVLQKMTKHRLHRTFMLSQYKASVRYTLSLRSL